MTYLSLFISLAMAQSVEPPKLNAQTLELATSGQGIRLRDPRLLVDGHSTWRTTLSYTDRPLEFENYYGQDITVVGGITQLQVGAAHSFGRVRAGVDVPFLLHGGGDISSPAVALGSIGLDGQMAIRSDESWPLALGGRLHLPSTRNAGAALSAPFGLSMDLTTAKVWSEQWRTTFQLGSLVVPRVELDGAYWGPRLRMGLGLRRDFEQQVPLIAEWVFEPQVPALGQIGSELLLATEVGLGDSATYTVRPALAAGLGDAPGTPRFRFLVQARREYQMGLDADADGINEPADLCPAIAEDKDGWEDSDGCPEPTIVTLTATDEDGYAVVGRLWTVGDTQAPLGESVALPAGEHTVTLEGLDHTIEVPTGAPVERSVLLKAPRGHLRVIVQDASGETIEAGSWSATGPTDLEGKPTAQSVPLRPGSYEVTVSAAGFRPATITAAVSDRSEAVITLTLAPSRVSVTGDQLDLQGSVYFQTGRAVIRSESHDLLNEVAALLSTETTIRRVRVEGHTDNRGAASANQALSQARAEAVMGYLVAAGVDSSRLEAVGFGESQPLDKRNTAAAWEKNRRVDFVVVERGP